MTDRPLVSIIVPVYNAEPYIADTIRRVLDQTYENWELLLADDASRDGSVSCIEPFLSDQRIRLIRIPENAGAANARNTGIGEAKGELIAFLDADDVWDRTKLEKQVAFLLEKDAVFTFTSYEFGDTKAQPTGRIVHAPEKLTYREALSRTVIFTSTVMFRLDHPCGGITLRKEDIRMPAVASEDTATWWKILRMGTEACGLDENLTVYRRPEKSLSSDKLVAIRRIWNLYRNCEGLGIIKSVRYFIPWAFRATLRRL